MTLSIKFYDHDLVLLSEGAIYWPQNNAVILSDIHLGVDNTPNTEIINPSKSLDEKDLSSIEQIVRAYQINQLIIIGNLVHTSFDKHHKDKIHKIRCKNKILVKGSPKRTHLIEELFDVYDKLDIDGLEFCYQANTQVHSPTIVGHVHPYVNLDLDRVRQRYRCFYQQGKQLILPTFGDNRRGKNMSLGIADQVYAITENAVLPLKPAEI